MILPYWELLRGDEPRFLPLIAITVHGRRPALDLMALVDSGAEQNVFGMDLARQLDIPLNHSRLVTVVGLGEHESLGRLTVVELQLGRHRWNAPVIFSEAANARSILGQAGFFAFFTVKFDYPKREMDIRRIRG